MATVMDYVKNYGNISFKEKPFMDADNVALCCCFYMPFEEVVSASFDDEPISFEDACNKLFAHRGNKHKPVGLVLVKQISMLMMEMAKQKRFAEMKILACQSKFETKPAVQFNAGTFLLPDGKILVVFRGTDDTLVGWQEDADIVAYGGTPSDALSIEYLAEVAKRYDGDIIVCGHSKGGYVAQYALMNSPKEVRDRVVALYNNDGPGLANYDYYSKEAYAEMLPKYKHIIPQSSFIGMMLAHDDDYMIVKSKRFIGAMQHDFLSWKFVGDQLDTAEEITNKSKLSDLVFNDVVGNVSDEQRAALGKVLEIMVNGINQHGLLDVKDHVFASIKGAKQAWKSIDADTKATFKGVLKYARRSIKKSWKTIKNGEYQPVKQRLY
ncbi:MAG: DUF2974 domain-containing protein [Eubacterium sp.]|nr:DUF2974 domain-containing protein [Eubacterium sp.]